MKFLEFLLLFLLFVLLFLGVYIFWLNFPSEVVQFRELALNGTDQYVGLPARSTQFYSNMRFSESEIRYNINEICDEARRRNFEDALEIISERTVLSFRESQNAQLVVTCSDEAPTPEQRAFFVAGEGGPTEIINSSRFAVILSGKVSLYRGETCPTPQIATHELLHALGFDHNNNRESIMYPVTNCNQKIDASIIAEIDRLYSIPSRGDLVIEKLTANKSGRYLSFDVTVANQGLKDMDNAFLKVFDEDLVKSFELGKIEIGAKKKLSVDNLRISRNAETVRLVVESSQQEISKTNNEAELVPS